MNEPNAQRPTELADLALAMHHALAQGRLDQYRRLARTRNGVLHALVNETPARHALEDMLRQAKADDERFVAMLSELRAATRAKIDDLHLRKGAANRLARGYRKTPARRGVCFRDSG
ncbi:MAG: hypothetical protein JXR37_37930 [Kiritimatiellae bacterium]|nr:hypothetical protein [Kiritimatiellia bacterium]